MVKTVEFDQIQGIVRFGYRKLTECSFLLVTIQDAAAARQWLAAAPVTSAVTLTDAPQTALQIALTHEGFKQLGCEPELLNQFSAEFQSGLSNSARARLLGDVGDSAPEAWKWGTGAQSVHLLLMLYARPGGLAEWKRSLQTDGWDQAFHVVTELTTADMDGVEPFGFPDGLSQPDLDWERQRNPPSIEDTYTNKIALGECLLGYPNEYQRYTDRPLLPPDAPVAEMLPEAEDHPGTRDFGRNGCYLVLRTLEQDVEGFWSFVRSQSETDEEAEALAAAMVGRKKDGTPMVPLSKEIVPGVDKADRLNHFNFDSDQEGRQCPLGAHIRRTNPRNGDLPSPPVTGIRRLLTLVGLEQKTLESDAKASSRFHRILRRGREYGPSTATTPASSGTSSRGLHFICLNANIARQFEFLQSAWIMSTKFDAMTDESDPLLGSREPIEGVPPTDTFSVLPEHGSRRIVCGVPRFVTVLGGAYFFLPSLPALRYLAAIR
jgi:deferrochelatase/peroxidase EfeB